MIQPIVIGTWCTLCLIAAAAMLVQIPYSLDELVATGQFLSAAQARRPRPDCRIFFVGDTDEGGRDDARTTSSRAAAARPARDGRRRRRPAVEARRVCLLIGVWLMLTRLTLGSAGGMANADHLIGALVLTVTRERLAEVARPLRFLNMALGAALLITPFAYGAGWACRPWRASSAAWPDRR